MSGLLACLLALAALAGVFDVAMQGQGLLPREALQTALLWCALAAAPAAVIAWIAGRRRAQRAALRFGLCALATALVGAAALPRLPAPAVAAYAISALALVAGWLGRSRASAPGAGILIAAAVGFASFGGGPGGGAGDVPETPRRAARGRPHVVIIVLDTLRADRLGAYGGRAGLTPAFDALAAEGTLYERCFATASWTVPSHASLFTGLYPRSHGASFDHAPWLEDRFVTLAESLAAVGYRTAGFSANRQLALANLDQGFDTWEPLGAGFSRLWLRRALQLLGLPARWIDHGAADGVDRVSRFLAASGNDEAPLFLFVNLLEPHWRYLPPLAERRARLPDDVDLFTATNVSRQFYGPLVMAGKRVGGPVESSIRALYDGAVAYQDGQLERLLASLDRHLDPAGTLLVITSDHGENLGEAGRWDHVFAVDDLLIHVPLVIRQPGAFPAGVRRSGLCQLVDVPPTVAAAVPDARIESAPGARDLHPARFQGRDYVVAEGDPYLDHLERMAAAAGPDWDPAPWRARLRAVRTDDEKLVWSSRDGIRLYDLGADPDETRDVAPERPRRAASLEAELEAWLQSQPAFQPQESPAREVSPEDRERLRELGYLP